MKTLFVTVLLVCYAYMGYAQGNRLFSGGEAANFGTLDLATPGGQSWATDRSSVPGYFSAVNTATFTGASDAANINGYVKKYGNQAFAFPVGNGSDLRTLIISPPSLTTDAYATAWIPGDPSGNLDPTSPNAGPHNVFSYGPGINIVSPVGQWDWQTGSGGNLGAGTTGTGAGLTITVSIPDMTAFGSTPTLRLVGWDGTMWVNLSGPMGTATGNTENSSLTGTMIAGITAIGIGKNVTILPLTLESFTITAESCNAILGWKTLNELNTDKFVIEQSTDGTNFKPAASVNASGNPAASTYRHAVAQSSGLAYYRLKMIDKNGSFTYSSVVTCITKCAADEYVLLYPNPVIANGIIYTSFNTAYQGKAILRMTNMQGQVLTDKAIDVTPGSNLVPMPVDKLATGTYYISIITIKGTTIGKVQRFMKQ